MKHYFTISGALLLATAINIVSAADLPATEATDAPPPVPAGYHWQEIPELTDNFDGNTLDRTKWMPKSPYWAGRAPSLFDPANVSVKDGLLRLQNTTRFDSLARIKNPATDIWVQAACVTSVKPVVFYGYYSVRLKASRICMTSSFWFQGKFSEIDVIEELGVSFKHPEEEKLMMSTTHYTPQGWDKDHWTPSRVQMPTGSAADFHVYGVWWKDATTIWFYLDGKKVAEINPRGPFNEPQYMFFDTEVFTWEGLPTIESLHDPARNTMLVDWVHSWRLISQTQSGN